MDPKSEVEMFKTGMPANMVHAVPFRSLEFRALDLFRISCFGFRALAVLAVLLLTGGRVVAQETFAGWHTSLERGAELSRESGRPLFVVFRCVR